jgi:hypothetical protein
MNHRLPGLARTSLALAALPLGCVNVLGSPPDLEAKRSAYADAQDERIVGHELDDGACVVDVGHWSFYGECAEDVGYGAGTPVEAVAAGTVVTVYPSCLGYAGFSVRVVAPDGRRFMYAHVVPSVTAGQWVEAGTVIGTVFAGSGAVYCAPDWSQCGIGATAVRSMLCWSGPHLHREAPCCRAAPGCTCDASCGYCWCGSARQGACPDAWYGTRDGCDCGCQWADPDCDPAPSLSPGSFAGVYCTHPGWGCGGHQPCWPASDCPSGSRCDWSAGDWGHCVY